MKRNGNEKYIRSIDLPFTIIRPAFFMENFKKFTEVQDQQLMIQGFIKKNTKLKMISVQDIGAFVSIAFNQPDKYQGKAVNIAGDEATLKQAAWVFSQEFNTACDVLESAREKFQANKMFRWYETDGYQADIPLLRDVYPDLLDLPSWVRHSNWDPFM